MGTGRSLRPDVGASRGKRLTEDRCAGGGNRHTVIHDAFGKNEYPGDPHPQGRFQGCEPFEEVGPFLGRTDWTLLEAKFLDAPAAALSFFSQEGFRFFLPANLVADLQGLLQTADPLFHLMHGFFETTVEIPGKGR